MQVATLVGKRMHTELSFVPYTLADMMILHRWCHLKNLSLEGYFRGGA